MNPEQPDIDTSPNVFAGGADVGQQPQLEQPQMAGLVAQPEKKSKMGLVVGLIIGLVLGAAITAAVFILVQGEDDDVGGANDNNGVDDDNKDNINDDGGNINSNGSVSVEEGLRAQKNTQREDDLKRFATTVTDFQSNNSGRLPFEAGSPPSMSDTFIQRYIDSRCSKAGFRVVPTGCGDRFTDPDGTTYTFAPVGNLATLSNDRNVVDLGRNNDLDHVIYVAQGFVCGSTAGTVRLGTGNRQFALFMILEGGDIICEDNQ